MSAQPLHPECWEVNIASGEEDERKPALLASKKVSDYPFEWFNPPGDVYSI